MVPKRTTKRKPPSIAGALLYRRVAAEAKTLSVHLEELRTARKQIDAAEDEVYRREAVAVVREAIRDFRLAQQSLHHAIAESREHFGLRRT